MVACNEGKMEMDYERIEKRTPQGGSGRMLSLSPGKLRNMLMGVDKKRKQSNPVQEEEDDDLQLPFSQRSQLPQIHHSGDCCSEDCKDVDVVSVNLECSTSTPSDSLALEMDNDRRLKDHHSSSSSSRIRSQDNTSLDYDSGFESISASSSPFFEFQRGERAQQSRVPLAPFSKPAPSKWDDAQKWIASPTSNRPKNEEASRKHSYFGYGSRQQSTKVIVEVPEQKLVPYVEPYTKLIDLSHAKKENEGQIYNSWEGDPCGMPDSYSKSVLMIENCIGDSAINVCHHDSSISIQSATTFIPPPSTARSVSMRDMGTEMTPIASQEPSRTGTPATATPIRSPSNSRPSTPGRTAPASSPIHLPDMQLDPDNIELSEKELQMKTRREIKALGTQLGKMNIAAWASKEEEDQDASTSLKTVGLEKPARSVIEVRAAAWEDAEKAKYTARFKREEVKIEAWENHQKAKSEAEMRKIEVEVERIRGRAHDKLLNKLAATRHKAEEKRAAAETKRNQLAAKTEEQGEYIRKTGRIPRSFSCCSWCF